MTGQIVRLPGQEVTQVHFRGVSNREGVDALFGVTRIIDKPALQQIRLHRILTVFFRAEVKPGAEISLGEKAAVEVLVETIGIDADVP